MSKGKCNSNTCILDNKYLFECGGMDKFGLDDVYSNACSIYDMEFNKWMSIENIWNIIIVILELYMILIKMESL